MGQKRNADAEQRERLENALETRADQESRATDQAQVRELYDLILRYRQDRGLSWVSIAGALADAEILRGNGEPWTPDLLRTCMGRETRRRQKAEEVRGRGGAVPAGAVAGRGGGERRLTEEEARELAARSKRAYHAPVRQPDGSIEHRVVRSLDELLGPDGVAFLGKKSE